MNHAGLYTLFLCLLVNSSCRTTRDEPVLAPPARWIVLDVATMTASPMQQRALSSVVTHAIAHDHIEVLSLSPQDNENALACADDILCLSLLGEARLAEHIVRPQLEALGDTTLVRMVLIDVRSKTQAKVEQSIVPGRNDVDLANAFERAARGLLGPNAETDDTSGLVERWWFWAAVLGAAAAGATTLVFALSPGGVNPDHIVRLP